MGAQCTEPVRACCSNNCSGKEPATPGEHERHHTTEPFSGSILSLDGSHQRSIHGNSFFQME